MEAVEVRILEEIGSVKAKINEMDKEIHRLREDFADAHLSEKERAMLTDALEDEKQGMTISLKDVEKRLRQ